MVLKEKRKKEINTVREFSWGTHISLFYKTKEDLLDILVPYFKAGLERNEYCVWIISDILDSKEVIKALRKAIPHFEKYLNKPQIEIIPNTEWYLKNGIINYQRVLKRWNYKLNYALCRGYAGMRVSGDTSWITETYWKKFYEYETEVNRSIENMRMIAVCSYSLNTLGASEIIDVVYNHPLAFIKQHGRWKIIESKESKRDEQEILKFKTISDRASYGISLIDLKGKLVYVNKSFAQMHGYSADELIGKNFSIFHDGNKVKNACKLNDMLRQNGSYIGEETWHKRKDKSFFPAFANGTLIRDEKGNPLFIAATAVDITERKSIDEVLRESEERFRTIFETAQDSIFIKDRNLRYIHVNPAMEKLFNVPASEFMGKTDMELFGPEDGKHIHEMDSRVLNGEIIEEEHTKTVNGIPFTFHVIKVPMYGKSGSITGLYGIARDITDRRRAEEKLKEENKLRQIFLDSLPPVAMLLKPHTREIVACNKAGKEVGAVPGRTCYGTWFKSASPCPFCRAPEVWKTGKAQHFQACGLDGRYWDAYWVPISDTLYLHYAYDVTDQRIQEQRNDVILRTSIDGFMITDMNGNIIEVNDAFCRMLGYAPDELIKMKITDIDVLELPGGIEQRMQKVKGTGYDCFETKHRCKDGRILNVGISANYLNINGGRFFAFIRDITDRKNAEKALQRSQEELDIIFNSAPALIWSKDKKGKYLRVNKTYCETVGLSKEKVIGKTDYDLYPEDIADQYCKYDRMMINSKKPVLGIIEHHLKPSGEYGWSLTDKMPFYDAQGNIIGTIGFSVDITEAKKAEEEIRSERDRLETVTENIGAGLVIISKGYRILWANKVIKHLFGDVEGKACYAKFYNQSSICHGCAIQQIFEQGKDKVVCEQKRRRPDGSMFWSEIIGTPIKNEKGETVAALKLVIPITERKKMEQEKQIMQEQIIQTEKMASLGEIAAGIAHELNTPLNVILGYLELIQKKLGQDSPYREYINISLEEIEQCRQLIGDFLFYARPKSSDLSKIEQLRLQDILNATVKLLTEHKIKKIKIDLDVDKNLPLIEGDRKQFMSVFVNLINNSMQAMPESGTIKISAQRIKDNSRKENGEKIEFKVADTGVGIPQENIKKVFDPFFTTKRPGKGTGLGLAVCMRIMQNHKGTLRIESEEGKGTTVIGELPVKS